MDLSNTSSWAAAQAAKEALAAVCADPQSTTEQKRAAQEDYFELMQKCIRESGVI